MPTKVKTPDLAQRDIIVEYRKQGYTTERIRDLHDTRLNGFGCHTIREVLRDAGLVDLNRSRRYTGVPHVTPEKKAEIADFIRNGGRHLPDRVVGEKYGMSEASSRTGFHSENLQRLRTGMVQDAGFLLYARQCVLGRVQTMRSRDRPAEEVGSLQREESSRRRNLLVDTGTEMR